MSREHATGRDRPADAGSTAGDSLDVAFADFVDALQDAMAYVREHPFYAEPENRARAHAFVANVLIARLEENVVADVDFPSFRVIDPRSREGADNPDQRYLVARVRGGDTYRIWGRQGSACRLEFQIYAGDPYLEGGRTGSWLAHEDVVVDDDGRFEVLLSPTFAEGNWLECPADATKLFVRQVYGEWTDADPGEVHIDRVGHEGDARPEIADDDMAARLSRVAVDLRSHARVWPQVVEHMVDERPANVIGPPRDSRAAGGVPGRWMAHGIFELEPDEALLVRTWPAGGNYQGIQLLDLWLESLEYANRQTSLTGEQAELGADGSYLFVVAAHDPGVVNWLDTVGRRRGVVLLRYDGTTTTDFDPEQAPTATKVVVADLAEHLPADATRVGPDGRRDALAARRRHVQVRFGN